MNSSKGIDTNIPSKRLNEDSLERDNEKLSAISKYLKADLEN